MFPLPNGNVTVFLRPEVRPDGALVLASPIGPFGTEGAYLVVVGSDRETGWVRRVPLAEEFSYRLMLMAATHRSHVGTLAHTRLSAALPNDKGLSPLPQFAGQRRGRHPQPSLACMCPDKVGLPVIDSELCTSLVCSTSSKWCLL